MLGVQATTALGQSAAAFAVPIELNANDFGQVGYVQSGGGGFASDPSVVGDSAGAKTYSSLIAVA
jgi:hypothetical protein